MMIRKTKSVSSVHKLRTRLVGVTVLLGAVACSSSNDVPEAPSPIPSYGFGNGGAVGSGGDTSFGSGGVLGSSGASSSGGSFASGGASGGDTSTGGAGPADGGTGGDDGTGGASTGGANAGDGGSSSGGAGAGGAGTGGEGTGGAGAGGAGTGGAGAGGAGTGGAGAGGAGTGGSGAGGTGTGGSGAGGASTGGSGAGGEGAGGAGGGPTAWPPVTDYSAAGSFPTTSETPATPACTIYRPSTLGEQGRHHPVILWGNGTFTTPAIYAAALQHWASHGFIVGAANTSNAGTGKEMIACLDYFVAENGRSGSAYFDKVDVNHVGAAGHSQGGGGTIMAGQDARVTVTAPLEPYTVQGFGGYDQASIGKQQSGSKMFLLSGSADNVATPTPNQSIVYAGVNVPVFWGMLAGADHVTTAVGNLNGFRGPMTAWFRAHLMDDQNARTYFYGASCGLCTNASWTVQRKGIQ
ncbi:MAG TPA: hypothetical protein VHE30_30130 [Polyangiaceae bacterium]|nr:hypothetical protein [Polyangiaceae bacterium]